jgi:hypothetical protein
MNMSKPTAVENLSTTPIRTIELSKKVDLINLIPDLRGLETIKESWHGE